MDSKKCRLLALSAVTTLAVLAVFIGMFARIEQPTPVTQLEATLAGLPLGVSAAEADYHMGSAPDSISKTRGVLMSPAIMLSPENELAAKYGPPHVYTCRVWSRDGVSAVVAIDTTGKVVGHWSWRPRDSK